MSDLLNGMNTMGNMGAPGMGDGSVSLDMPPEGPPPVVTEMDDGGIEIDVNPHDAQRPTPEFDDNLAEHMDETALNAIATRVLDSVEKDRESRSEWAGMLTQGMDLLGLKFTDRSFPFEGACGVYDTILLEAVMRNTATTTGELLPATGPAKSQIVGIPTELTEQKATRTKDWTNYYLMEGAPEWVENMEQMFLWRAIAGSTFKKVYQDPIMNRPVSPFLTPNQLIFNNSADSELDTCSRITHVITYSYKEIRQRQLTGFYCDVVLTLPQETDEQDVIKQKVDSIVGFTNATSADDSEMMDKEFECYEQHVDIELSGFEHKDQNDKPTRLPLPYIITVDKSSRKVLGIRRNWREGDKSYAKQQYFVHYKLFPGLGAMGMGFAHILGNPAKAATALLRQMTDAETLNMFPGGLRVKGMRMDDNNKMVGPCEFIEIDTGGLPISAAVAPMPYKGASEVSFNLWVKGRENAQNMASMADISVGDGRQDAPVGTTLALLEAANRLMSATVKSAHRSLKKELKLFAALFGQYLPEKPYPFPVPGGQQAIMRADFSDEIDVIPVSDPNITSYAQRVTRAEAMLRFAMQAPQIHDLRAAYKNMYIEMGVDERKIGAILPDPKVGTPMDPLAENALALTGKPLMVGAYQDHQAHIQAHNVLIDQVPTIAAHISEHLAAAMRVNVEKLLGIQLPPMGTQLPPDVENKIAVLVAQALEHLKTPQGQEPTPGQIAMAEIQVEAQKVQATLQQVQQNAATAAFQAQKKYLASEADREERLRNAESDRQNKLAIAALQSATTQAIAKKRDMSNGKQKYN